MLTGLRKRETYEELINELGDDPIKKYPDRKASQIENSNYMSQLASGFQEVIAQNDRIMREKTKQLLLQEMASSSGTSHQGLRSMAGSGGFRSLGPDDFISEAGEAPGTVPTFSIATPRDGFHDLIESHAEGLSRLRDQFGIPQPAFPSITDYSAHQIALAQERARHRAVTQPLIEMNNNMQREYEQQLAIQNAELADERQRHQTTSDRLRGRVRALLDEVQNTSIGMMIPDRQVGGSSSSSAAPMRIAIQDAAQQPLQAIQDKEPSSSSSSEERAPVVGPGRLQPRTQDVRHLYQPKHERRKKRTTAGDKEHFDTVEEWMREGIKFLKEQITHRPGIKLSKTELHDLTKERAVYLIREYDRTHPKT